MQRPQAGLEVPCRVECTDVPVLDLDYRGVLCCVMWCGVVWRAFSVRGVLDHTNISSDRGTDTRSDANLRIVRIDGARGKGKETMGVQSGSR